MKRKIYFDTSIISAYFDERKLERQKITQMWWVELEQKYEAYISEIVEAEISDTPDEELRLKMYSLVENITSLTVNSEVRELAEKYLLAKVFPDDYLNDSLQIGIATVYGVDIVVSWNFGHMVNYETRRKVKAVNILNGYKEIEIVSPLELGGEKYE